MIGRCYRVGRQMLRVGRHMAKNRTYHKADVFESTAETSQPCQSAKVQSEPDAALFGTTFSFSHGPITSSESKRDSGQEKQHALQRLHSQEMKSQVSSMGRYTDIVTDRSIQPVKGRLWHWPMAMSVASSELEAFRWPPITASCAVSKSTRFVWGTAAARRTREFRFFLHLATAFGWPEIPKRTNYERLRLKEGQKCNTAKTGG